MPTLWQDLRYGARQLLAKPVFTVVAVLTLALGIGANTAIFSVVNAVILKSLPFRDPGRLVVLWTSNPKIQTGLSEIPPANTDIPEWKSRSNSFERIAAFTPSLADLSSDGEPERVGGVAVSADFFPLFGVAPLLGRVFTEAENESGNDKVAVIGYGLWQRRFGGDAGVIGRKITVNDETRSIVGVMPPEFQFPRGAEMPGLFGFAPRADLWLPLGWAPERWQERGTRELVVLARLKPDVALRQAQSEMDAIARQQDEDRPAVIKGWQVTLTPLDRQVVGETRPVLWLLTGAVGLVLLIACANVANLLLTRATTRRREISIRTALGASRSRIVRQLVTESLMLALAGGGLGLLLAVWLVPALVALSPADALRPDEIRVDWLVMAFTLTVSLLTGILFGLAPAIITSQVNLNEELKGAERRTSGARGLRAHGWLIAAEVAFSLVLLAGAGLLLRSLARLQAVNPGFRASGVTAFDLSLNRRKYPTDEGRGIFFDQLLARVGSIGGVEGVAAISSLPLSGQENIGWMAVEGRVSDDRGNVPHCERRAITPDYFRVMDIPLRQGRAFTARDDARSPLVVVVNETLARTMLPGADPIGRRIKLNRPESNAPWRTIVGVVGDVRHASLSLAPLPQVYLPYPQWVRDEMTMVVRSSVDRAALAAALKNEVRSLDPALPLAGVRTIEGVIAQATVRPRFSTLLLALFAVVALALAVVGIYGSVAWAVTQRTHEIGLRMALGARPADVLGLVIGQAMKLVLVGVATGLAASLALARLMTGLLFGVSATDPLTFAGVALLLAAVALLACYFPARRATRVDPGVALRYE